MKLRRQVIGLFTVLLLMRMHGLAQGTLTFGEADSLSYRAYLEQDWKKVRLAVHSSLEAGYDYYYLRMRAGIAEYARNRPGQAIAHFRKALEFSRKDPDALAYLYLSLLNSANYQEARLLYDSLPAGARQRYEIPQRKPITGFFIEPGYFFNPAADSLAAVRPEAEYTHHYTVPSYLYAGAGFSFEAGRRFSGTLAANTISFTADQQFITANNEPITKDVSFSQQSLYLAGEYYLGKGFAMELAGQVLSATYPLYSWKGSTFGGEYVEEPFHYRDFALHASLVKRFPFVLVRARADLNRFKGKGYLQAGADLTLLPTGSRNLYFQSGGTWVKDSLNPFGRFIFDAKAGIRLFRETWLEGFCSIGQVQYYSEKSAYVVYNNFDPIKQKAGINLLFFNMFSHLDLALRYQWSQRLASWQLYSGSNYLSDFTRHYSMQGIIGGITWRF
jgi:hypothetical protein